MPSTNIRSILLNMGVMLADNNVRRSVGAFSFNYTSNAGNVVQSYVTVNDSGGTYTQITPMNPSKLTMVFTDQPLSASITPRGGIGIVCAINQMLAVDYDISQFILTNSGSLPAKVVIVQI